MDLFTNFLSDIDKSFLSIPVITQMDVIDILIVAFFVYKIMLWIKETRAWALFKGILLISLVWVLAYFLRLNTTYWLVYNTFNVGLVAIIVIFQPEMRKALEQIGKGMAISFSKSDQEQLSISETTAKELCIALRKMASERTGALVLVENEVPLGDHEQTGIQIDAVVSSQLLINIFEDKTPLHDGAVIIRNNRIAAASCILPLTQTEIGRELGTRHRAAVGVSEVSDAFVLVVSEETGRISMARGGKLMRNVSDAEIMETLLSDENQQKELLTKIIRNKRTGR